MGAALWILGRSSNLGPWMVNAFQSRGASCGRAWAYPFLLFSWVPPWSGLGGPNSRCRFAPIPGFSDCPATVAPSSGWLAKLVAFNPLLRFPEFLLGIALSRLFILKRQSALSRPPAKKHFLSSVALIGIVSLLSCSRWIPYPFLHNGLLDMLFAMLIYGLANMESRSVFSGTLGRWLSNPIFVLLGEAGYAVYILHVPLRNWMYRILECLNQNVQPSMALFVSYTLITLGASILVFKVIEEPARRIIRHMLTPARAARKIATV
jgi:peptidoglycan/LPS O-acetylase OafA/YrhL